MKKLFLTGVIGVTMLGAIPAFAATNTDSSAIHRTSNTQPPQMQDGQRPPDPPKDANGNPLPPPDRQGQQGGNGMQQPPEPPKDANGNPLPPPDRQQGQNENQSPNDGGNHQPPQHNPSQNTK